MQSACRFCDIFRERGEGKFGEKHMR